MPFVASPEDGARLFYVDYRPSSLHPFRPNETTTTGTSCKTLFFLHGWPMNGRMYEHLMLPLSQTHGIRCIASDRRGFGKSEWSGPKPIEVSYDTFARDTFAIISSVRDMEPFIFVCSSMGCGESLLVYELMKQAGQEHLVKGFMWLGPSMPYPMQTELNPQAPSKELWTMILDGFRQDRVGFVKASIGGVFGVQHGVEMSETAQEFYISLVHLADAIAIERCCQILSNYDFTAKLKDFGNSRPAETTVTILHGAKDQSMPVEASSALIEEYVPGSKTKIFENAAHGLYYTSAADVLELILAQLKE